MGTAANSRAEKRLAVQKRNAGRHRPRIHPSPVLGSGRCRIWRSETRSLFAAVLAPIPCLDIKIRGIHFASPFVPLPLNRYLYHFLGADTKKHRNFDTMGIRIEVFFFCLKALGTRAFGLLRYLLLPSRTIARRHYSSHESRVAVSYRLFLWLPFNLWAIVCSSTFAPLQEVKFL